MLEDLLNRRIGGMTLGDRLSPPCLDFSLYCIPDAPLARFNSFRIDAQAELLVIPRTVFELADVQRLCREVGLSIRVLGHGTNTLFRSKRLAGLTLQLSAPAFSRVTVNEKLVTAGAGASLYRLVTQTVRAGLKGIELLSGIPGTLGGAIAGNSGTRFGAIGSVVKRVRVLTMQGRILDLINDEIQFDYRRTNLPHGCIILEADLCLEKGVANQLRLTRSLLLSDRRASQPISERTVGCIFRNPSGSSAGALIDRLGLKGMQVGRASVSSRHANFIVARPGATGEDIYRLLDAVRERVADRLGIVLIPEVTIW